MKKKKSVQDLIGLQNFTDYGLQTEKEEILYFSVAPTNISVLSHENTEVKIHHLMMVLSAVPYLEIICMDSCESFDENKLYIKERLLKERNPKVREVLQKDYEFLDSIQVEMATARQFLFAVRVKQAKKEQVFQFVNRVEKAISNQGFEIKRLKKADIKRMIGLYFQTSANGNLIEDADGESLLLTEKGKKKS